MIKRFLMLVVAGWLPFQYLSAQVTHLCDQPYYFEEAVREDPGYLDRINELEAFTKDFISRKQALETIYTVPVVVHVMHTYGDENISREQVIEAINQLNLDYSKSNSDTGFIIAPFKGLAGNVGIRFKLAQLDPEGNCTDGILRILTPLTHAADDNIKDLSRWPRSEYLNIWVVGTIASGAAGYSYYPGVNADRDGVVLRSDYMGSIGSSSTTRAHTLSHEVGHWLNLAHPWGNTNDPGVSTNCETDDDVEDTPNTIGHTSCDLWAETCGSLDNVQNFMEYSYCTRMFTNGQAIRMIAALNSNTSSRKTLWQESNLWATGTHPSYQTLPCTPIADFMASTTFSCTATNIQFFDYSYNSQVGQWHWYFPGGSPSESFEKNPIISYSAPGSYAVHLKSYSQTGSDSTMRESYINIQNNDTNVTLPFIEDFESSSFPVASNYPTSQWYIEGDAINTWTYTSLASSLGNSCVFLNNRENNYGEYCTLISPIINIPEHTESISLHFEYAYVQSDEQSEDELLIYLSKDCGTTWMIRYTNEGYFLSSTGELEDGIFIPNSSDWKSVDRDLTSLLVGSTSFHLKFKFTNAYGNNFFLDNLQINAIINTPEFEISGTQILLHPNPVKENGNILITSKASYPAEIQIYNIQGSIIATQAVELIPGNNEFALKNLGEFSKGIYFVKVETSAGVAIEKLVIQ
ncbi:MAG: T9SS type A sorting domain-containing protein [Bacteroidales bacterium]|nr:T9SS type A sorting domain-containing protein [Bacteroidales bacterium]